MTNIRILDMQVKAQHIYTLCIRSNNQNTTVAKRARTSWSMVAAAATTLAAEMCDMATESRWTDDIVKEESYHLSFDAGSNRRGFGDMFSQIAVHAVGRME